MKLQFFRANSNYDVTGEEEVGDFDCFDGEPFLGSNRFVVVDKCCNKMPKDMRLAQHS